jgi:uncharacterized Zn finger protein (UPF0148 family)
MAPYPRGERNVRMECDCGSPVVKEDGVYVCIGCGERIDVDERRERADPVA